MADKRIANLFNVKNRFLRSTQLERDFRDSKALSGYVATDFIRACANRMGDGLRPSSGQRAWRITGDYGSGKSSFALLLAHVLSEQRDNLPKNLQRLIDFAELGVSRPNFIPVLITCSRQPLGTSILRGLHRSICHQYGRRSNAKAAESITRLIEAKREPSDEQIVGAILQANSQLIADGKGRGLLFVIDELGKFLEFAALYPQRQDVFLLQRLAETASRSAHEPLFLVCLLHQGFNAYADHLDQSAQREWEKVAGRFEEIVFSQPIEQIGDLVASALNIRVDHIPKAQGNSLHQSMQRALDLGWFGPANRDAALALAKRLYPLHPTVLPVLIRVFRRFGQNERSLFSFLLSGEPFGLQMFSEQRLNQAKPYQLHNLFDYVRTTFGHRLVTHSYRSHWNLIESVVESYAGDDPLQLQVLKTVGILNLLNDDLLATEESVLCALEHGEPSVLKHWKAALDKLRKKGVLFDRGRARGLCLWPHTSVDLEQAYEEARCKIEKPESVAGLIRNYLEMRPVVARRHYIETGNLRYFDIRYSAVSELQNLLNDHLSDGDGTIVVPLCETVAERDDAVTFAKENEMQNRQNWLIAVPQPLSSLAGLVQEVQRWEWIFTNIQELNGDKYGREEASRQLEAARSQLRRRIQNLVGFKQFGHQTTLEWFNQGGKLYIRDGRHLLSVLSNICDETFCKAPRIHNELVNRRNLSSAAAAARMRLVERMFSHAKSQCLGMNPDKKPPEMSMYLSVLLNTGIHQQHGGTWAIGEPSKQCDEACRVLPGLKRIDELLKQKPDARLNAAELFAELRKPPFGVRNGMAPLLLTVFAIGHEQEVAFYKDGTFLREMTGEHMLVLTKQPELFEVQYCRIEGVRAELYEKLLTALEVGRSTERQPQLLDVVKPLCIFVAHLPAWVHNTKKLSPAAIGVREIILNARDPARLLFHDLPKSCGFNSFEPTAKECKDVHAFIKVLKASLDELRAAYPELQQRLRMRLRELFDLPGPFQQFRTGLARRAEQVVLGVTEPKLRAFCLRLMDDNLPESEWLESIGSFLALKPPAKWHDAEEDLFNQELAPLATRFHRVESICFADGKAATDGRSVRLAITEANGNEYERVIHFSDGEQHRLNELQKQFQALFASHPRLALAAASKAIWTNLVKAEKKAK